MTFSVYRARSRDWLGYYNDLLHQQGEDTTIGSELVDPRGVVHDRMTADHREIDGISLLAKFLRHHGYTEGGFPKTTRLKSRGTFSVACRAAAIALGELKPMRALEWKFPRPGKPYTAFGPAHVILSAESSARLRKRAETSEASLVAILLRYANMAVVEAFLVGKPVTHWHIPVSFRGHKGSGGPEGNFFSNFVQAVAYEEGERSISSKQAEQFRRGDAVATDLLLTLGDVSPLLNLLPGKVKRDYANPRVSARIAGTFSFLGRTTAKGAPNRIGELVGVPFGNVSLKNPVCFVGALWHERVVIGVTAHSSVCPSLEAVRALAADLQRRLEAA
jgi:hypothetical protein